jgi:glycosyltransferase involved in cell wall biosynthesis
MRIGIFSDVFYPYLAGGGENRYYNLAKHLVAAGDDIHVVTSKLLGCLPYQTLFNGKLRIHRVGFPRHPRTRRSILPLPGYALSAVAHAELIKECDILDLNTYASALAGKLVSVLKKKPSIVTVHDLFAGQWSSEHNVLASVLGSMSERLIALSNSSGFFMTVSQSTKRKIIRQLKVNESRIFVVPNGVDFERIQCLAQKAIRSSSERIVYVGRLIPYKRVNEVLELVARLRRRGLDVKADIIGDGPEREHLESLARQMGVSRQVTFWGFLRQQEDVTRILSSAAVFVTPSIFEGFGMSVLEAMAAGTPVVAYDLEAYREYARDKVNCMLARPGHFEELVHNVSNLMTSPDNAREISRNGIETARGFDWRRVTEKVRAVYRLVAG